MLQQQVIGGGPSEKVVFAMRPEGGKEPSVRRAGRERFDLQTTDVIIANLICSALFALFLLVSSVAPCL